VAAGAKPAAKAALEGPPPKVIKDISVNRKVFHDYHIMEGVEAGIVLTGTEIKAIRQGKADLRDGYAQVKDGQVTLYNAHIGRYDPGNRYNHEPERPRRLMLHKRQIIDLLRKTQGTGLTLIPLKLYLKGDIAKVELVLVRGKKEYDKRQDLAKRDAERDIARAMRHRVAAG
jgi:SsrA-binding protein